MPIDYSISKPTAGTSRSTSPTEVEILTDVSDTIADVGSRLDALESGTSQAGLLADRPAASADNAGRLYFATDVNGGTLYRSNGTSWVQVALGVTEQPTPLVARRTTDATAVNNSTTLVDDDQLVVAVEANTVYEVSTLIPYAADPSADLKIGWSTTAGGGSDTFNWTVGSLAASAPAGATGDMNVAYTDLSTTRPANGASVITTSPSAVARPCGILTIGGTAGNFWMRWAQNVAHASDAIVFAGATLILRKIA